MNNTLVYEKVDLLEARKIIDEFVKNETEKGIEVETQYCPMDELMLYFIECPDEYCQNYFAQCGRAALVIDVDLYNRQTT